MPNTVNTNVKKPNLQVHKDTTDKTLEAKVNPALKTNVEEHEPELVNWFDDFNDFIDPMSVYERKMYFINDFYENGLDELNEMGFDFSKDDIKDLENTGDGRTDYILTMKDGTEIAYVLKDDSFSLTKMTLSDGTEINFDISDGSQNAYQNLIELNEDKPIRGYVSLDVNGHETKVFWVKDDVTDFDTFKAQLDSVKKAINETPSNVLDKIFGGYDFWGIFVGSDKSQNGNTDGDWIAIAHGNEYIYINTNEDPYYETVIHEFGHIFDCTIGNYQYKSSIDENAKKLYNRHKNTIKELIPTNTGYHYDGPPNVTEFFACAFEIYLVHPDELEELLPDVYEYINDIVVNA